MAPCIIFLACLSPSLFFSSLPPLSVSLPRLASSSFFFFSCFFFFFLLFCTPDAACSASPAYEDDLCLVLFVFSFSILKSLLLTALRARRPAATSPCPCCPLRFFSSCVWTAELLFVLFLFFSFFVLVFFFSSLSSGIVSVFFVMAYCMRCLVFTLFFLALSFVSVLGFGFSIL